MGELLLWWCLQDTGTNYPQPGTWWIADNAPDWLKRDMIDAGTRRLVWFPETELPHPDYFAGVVYIMYRRRIGNALPYPDDFRGPRYGGN